MIRRLGGWARLGIVLSCVWAIAVAALTGAMWPSPTVYETAASILAGGGVAGEPHNAALAAFIASTDEDDLQAKIETLTLPRSVKADLWDLKYAQPKIDWAAEAKKFGGVPADSPPVRTDVTPLVQQPSDYVDYRLVRSPNGRLYRFPADATDLEIGNALQADLQASASAEKRTHLRSGFLLWSVPILSMYVLALTTRWVYRGFHNS